MTDSIQEPAPEGLDPDSSQGTGAVGGGVAEGVPTRAVRPPAPSIELITYATRLWHRRRTDPDYSHDRFERDLFTLEMDYGLDVTRCERCRERHGIRRRQSLKPLCDPCYRIEWGDQVDRGWEAYRDATDHA